VAKARQFHMTKDDIKKNYKKEFYICYNGLLGEEILRMGILNMTPKASFHVLNGQSFN
jgi:hypothetical protein